MRHVSSDQESDILISLTYLHEMFVILSPSCQYVVKYTERHPYLSFHLAVNSFPSSPPPFRRHTSSSALPTCRFCVAPSLIPGFVLLDNL